MILDSEVYSKQYEEFVNTSTKKYNSTGYSDILMYHFHYIHKVPETERFTKKYKRIYLPEVATQFRTTGPILSVDFKGYGAYHIGGGFSTDISDACHWLTLYVKQPENPHDFRYELLWK